MTIPTGNRARISALLVESGLDWLLLATFDGVCFATGHVCDIERGPSPFSGGPTLALVGRDGSAGIVCANTEEAQIADFEYERYEGFAGIVADSAGNYRIAVQRLAQRLGVSGRLGVDRAGVPYGLADILPSQVEPFGGPLERLRAIKTEAEIARLQRAAEVAATGQQKARQASRVGESELSVFGAARSAMEVAAGERCAVAGEYLAGRTRTATLGLQPGDYVLAAGDPVLCDLAPRVNGYWGDSCGSFVIAGAPADDYVRMWEAARETLELAVDELRPGLKVSGFDRLLRANMQRHGYSYPHHSGHGIGAGVHEFPRLVPNEHSIVEEDMVLMVEPGAYLPGLAGVRCEFMLRVRGHGGAEVLTPFAMAPALAECC